MKKAAEMGRSVPAEAERGMKRIKELEATSVPEVA
jgi:hypothetical protein